MAGLFLFAASKNQNQCGSHVSCPHDLPRDVKSQTTPPAGYRLAAVDAKRIANATDVAKATLRRYPRALVIAQPTLPGQWQVAYVSGRDRARIKVDDRSGSVIEADAGPFPQFVMLFYGYAVEWRRVLLAFMFGAAALFALALLDWRRLRSLANLDVAAMLAWLVPLTVMSLDRQDIAVWLVYPPLLYLLARLLMIGFGRAQTPLRRLPPVSKNTLLAVLLVVVGLRVVLNLAFGFVTDEGYGGVFGANSIHHGYDVYANDTNTVDVYGPLTYLSYVPFELVFPMDPNWLRDYLPAAHAASIVFDLIAIALMYVLGRRLARGDARGGLLLALAWATLPYTLFVLAESDNDALVAACCAGALVALGRPAVRGALVGYGAAAKFAPAVMLPLIAAGYLRGRVRDKWLSAASAVLVIVVAVAAYLPDGGLNEFAHTTLLGAWEGESPFSAWGHLPAAVDPLRYVMLGAIAVLALWLFFRPRPRSLHQVAAFGGALLIALQLTRTHWLYPYVLWFAPLAIVALFGRFSGGEAADELERGEPLLVGEPDVRVLAQ